LLVAAGKRRRRKGWMFVSAYVLELASDRDWLNKAKDTLSVHWEQKSRTIQTKGRCRINLIQPKNYEKTTHHGSRYPHSVLSITYFGDVALTVFGHMPVCVRRLILQPPAELKTKAGNLKKANLHPSWL
jgi:hypothetical protein